MLYKDISEQIKAAGAERLHAESLGQLVSELELRTQQMALLNEMGGLLECCATTQEASAVVSRSVQKLFPEASSGTLYLFRSSRNLVETAVSWSSSSASLSEAQFAPDDCWALRRGQSHWSICRNVDIHCPHLAAGSGAECLCVPMVAQGDTLGVMLLEFKSGTQAKTALGSEGQQEAIQSLATTAAGQIALSLASLRLREKLRDQSIRDPLTGLFNRRFMEESLQRERGVPNARSIPFPCCFLTSTISRSLTTRSDTTRATSSCEQWPIYSAGSSAPTMWSVATEGKNSPSSSQNRRRTMRPRELRSYELKFVDYGWTTTVRPYARLPSRLALPLSRNRPSMQKS